MRQELIWRGMQVIEKMERETGLEPATSSLGNWKTGRRGEGGVLRTRLADSGCTNESDSDLEDGVEDVRRCGPGRRYQMRSGRTRETLLARLERLELLAVGVPESKLRFGHLRPLPKDYQGERHTVIAKHLPNQGDQEWVEFEEVPGPAPSPKEEHGQGGPRYMNIVP